MEHGFFTLSDIQKQTGRTIPKSAQCGRCGLYKQCKSPNMKYTGEGRKKILIVGEAPGRDEDEVNEQFVGKAGKRLRRELRRFKIDLNRDCWKTNVIRCRPPENKSDSKMIANCRPALFKEIEELNPDSILLFGKSAAESVLDHIWGQKENLSTWLEWVIPCTKPNSWISVHYHPSYLERQSDGLLDLVFRMGLRKALKKNKKPHKKIKDYESCVKTIYDERSAVKEIRAMAARQKPFAFDYEANCLKHEYVGAEIKSCSMSDGKTTFAYPWTEKTAQDTSVILKSRIPKIASNAKFENRWTKHFLGHNVRGWWWDTMLAAHILNNNTGVTGLKFQAFVKLGVLPYDRHIEPFLKTGKGTHINRIDEIPLKDLLIYNGMDSLLEYLVAKMQRKEMGYG